MTARPADERRRTNFELGWKGGVALAVFVFTGIVGSETVARQRRARQRAERAANTGQQALARQRAGSRRLRTPSPRP